jgi:hypothetical protein
VSISNRKAEVDEMLHDAEVTNAREDKAFGKDRRGDELPKHLQTKERRLAAMRKAKADLEERARTDAAEKAGNKVDEQGLGDDEKATLVDAAAAVAVPKAPRRYRLLQRGQRRRDDHLTSASCSGSVVWGRGHDLEDEDQSPSDTMPAPSRSPATARSVPIAWHHSARDRYRLTLL